MFQVVNIQAVQVGPLNSFTATVLLEVSLDQKLLLILKRLDGIYRPLLASLLRPSRISQRFNRNY